MARYRLSIFVVTLVAVQSFLSMAAFCDKTAPPDRQADLLASRIKVCLGEAQLYDPQKNVPTVTIVRLGDKAFAVRLSGEVADADTKKDIVDLVRKATEPDKTVQLILDGGLKVKKELAEKETTQSVTETWPLANLFGGTGSYGSGIDSLVDTMNSIYGEKDKPVVFADKDNLWLKGSLKQVLEMKTFLARISGPWPQVQMDMWAIQFAGKQDEVARNATLVMQDIERVKGKMAAVQMLLGDAIQSRRSYFATDDMFLVHGDPGEITQANCSLADVGFDRGPDTALSLIDSLVYLGMSEQRTEILRKLETELFEFRSGQMQGLDKAKIDLEKAIQAQHVTVDAEGSSEDDKAKLEELELALEGVKKEREILEAEEHGPQFPCLKLLLSQKLDMGSSPATPFGATPISYVTDQNRWHASLTSDYTTALRDADRKGVRQFAWAAHQFGDLVCGLRYDTLKPDDVQQYDREATPERLVLCSSAMDGMLKAMVEAYNADLKTMYLDPLLRRIQSMDYSKVSGVNMAGKVHLVVTSRMQSTLKPDLVSYVENTRPAPLDIGSVIDTARPGKISKTESTKTTISKKIEKDAEGKETTTETTTEEPASSQSSGYSDLTGLSALMAQLPQGQAIALAAALTSDVQPTFTQVAPGIDVKVTPTMLPSAGTAHLSLDFSFGVATQDLGTKDRKDVWPQSPPDAVQTSRATTEAAVDGSALFDVSSFAMTTTAPSSWYLPVLGRLPLIGPAFQFPRRPKEIHHESIVLVNATLIPRAMGLIQFYAGGNGLNFNGTRGNKL